MFLAVIVALHEIIVCVPLQETGRGSGGGISIERLSVELVVVHDVVVAEEALGIQSRQERHVPAQREGRLEPAADQALVSVGVLVDHGQRVDDARVVVLGMVHGLLVVIVERIERGEEPRATHDVRRGEVAHLLFIHMTCEVDVEGQVLGDLRVDVGAQRVLVIGNRRVLQEALLILVTETGIEGDLVVAAAGAHRMLRLGRRIAEDGIFPVVGLLLAVAVGGDILLTVLRNRRHVVYGVHRVFLVVERHPVGRIHEVGEVRGTLPRYVARIIDIDPALVAFLGGDKHDAVTALHAVDGCRRILQHRNLLDIFGIEPRHVVARHTVDHDKRSAEAADVHRGIELARFAGVLSHAESRDLTGQHVLDVLVLGRDDLFVVDGRDGSRKGGFLLGAVTYDDQLLDFEGVALQHEIIGGLSGYDFGRLLGVSDEAHPQHRAGSSLQREAARRTRYISLLGRGVEDRSSDHRLPGSILDGTRYRKGLPLRAGFEGRESQRHAHTNLQQVQEVSTNFHTFCF